jgi:methyl-accepting chemotaxis protein
MFKNIRIGAKLGIGFGTIFVIIGVIVVVGSVLMGRVVDNATQVEEKDLPFALLADKMVYDSVQVQQFMTDAGATRWIDVIDEADESAEKFRKGLEEFRGLYESEGDTAGLRFLDDLEKKFDEYHEFGRTMALAYINEGVEGGNKTMKEFDGVALAMAREVGSLQKKHADEAKEMTAEIIASADRVEQVMFVLSLLALVLGALIAYLTARSITVPLGEAVDINARLAEGDLSVDIDVTRTDETSDNVSSGSQQLSSSAEEMSQGASEQASSAEEASASIEEMVTTIRQNADNAQQTEKTATKAAADAKEGGKAVEETVQAMKDIASKITIIEEISRQTNLLGRRARQGVRRRGRRGQETRRAEPGRRR